MGSLGKDQDTFLLDPQQMNAYSYARDNPIVGEDPSGKVFGVDDFAELAVFGAYEVTAHASEIENGVIAAYNLVTSAQAAHQTLANNQSSNSDKAWAIAGVAIAGISGSAGTEEGGEDSTQSLPDDALVCRGGNCGVGSFQANAKTYIENDNDAIVNGVSVNSAQGKTVEELSATLPQKNVGVVTAKDIREAGGDVVPMPTQNNPDHAQIVGLTNNQLGQVFENKVTLNPSRGK